MTSCTNAPCLNCKARFVGCHDACPKYQEFKKINEERKKKIKRLEQLDAYARRY